MNINKIVKDSVNGIKDKYNNTTINPFKFPEKLKVEFTINYTESLKSLPKTKEDLQILTSFIKLIKKEVIKELE
ncbi:MAG: hypothetical protein H8D84_00795 [Proteobacteria bacterium]|nr:hypothetical protein [Pseudomonadota bacterium]